jgi:hypothetical protein
MLVKSEGLVRISASSAYRLQNLVVPEFISVLIISHWEERL